MDWPDAAQMAGLATATTAIVGGVFRWLGSADRKKVRELEERLEDCEKKHGESEAKHAASLVREELGAKTQSALIDAMVKLRRDVGAEDDTGVHRLLEHQTAILRERSEPHQVAVLLVDDDGAARRSVERVLEAQGFIVLAVPGVSTAIDALRSQHVDVIVADLLMPGQSGVDLVRLVHREWPAIPIILISGEVVLGKALAKNEAVRFLAKPFTAAELAATITEVLEAP